MMVIVLILYSIGALAALWFFPCWWHDKKSSAPGACLAIAITCLGLAWLIETIASN